MKRSFRISAIVIFVLGNFAFLSPAASAGCTDDTTCLDQVACSVAYGVNKVSNRLGQGDVMYCLY